jgi:hypothetical protein
LKHDVPSVLEFARARAATARERHVLLAGELYGVPHGLVTDAERALLTGMIAGLVMRIAARLDVAMGQDAERTAEVLRRAGVLSDPDLVGPAYHRLLEFELERRTPPNDVAATLAAGQDIEVVHAVTAYRVWRAARVDSYSHPLLDEADLPLEATTRLYWLVAAARGRADPAREDLIEAATVGEVSALASPTESPPETAARRLVAAGQVDATSLPVLIEAGEISLVEALLAQLASIPLRLARRFLFEPGGEGLAVAARAGGLDCAALTALIAAGRGARPRGADCASALALFDGLDSDTAAHALRRLARHPAYLDAVRRLEG